MVELIALQWYILNAFIQHRAVDHFPSSQSSYGLVSFSADVPLGGSAAECAVPRQKNDTGRNEVRRNYVRQQTTDVISLRTNAGLDLFVFFFICDSVAALSNLCCDWI